MNRTQKSIKVALANAVRQHSHHTAYALEQLGFLSCFFTSFWHNQNGIFAQIVSLLPKSLSNRILSLLNRRTHPNLDYSLVKTFISVEIVRILYSKLQKSTNEEKSFLISAKRFDKKVASRINKNLADVVIGYEMSAAETFRCAKAKGIKCVLDLAQVHWKEIEVVRLLCPEFDQALPKGLLLEQITKTKQLEYDSADYILSLSKYASRTLVENGIEEEKVKLLPLGVDLSLFSAKNSYRKQGALRLLYVGTIMPRKGVKVLVDAVESFSSAEVELTLIGPAGVASKWVEGNSRISYFPYMSQKDLVSQYQAADLFVLPSFLDSWGQVVAEAAACGTPSIVTKNTGAADIIEQGCGSIISINDSKALRESINSYLNNRDEIEVQGKKAIEVVSNYSWEHYTKNLGEFINSIL